MTTILQTPLPAPGSRVVVAMSGGVDSSVAAALLVEQGYEVIGMMLRLWSEPGQEDANRCCTPDAMAQARRVAAILGIPFYAIDAQDAFHQAVVQTAFLDGYAAGGTPNPCLTCNRSIRWGVLLRHALAAGATHLATGHYARLHRAEDGGTQIFKSADAHKDQSYVLHVLSQEQLGRAIFPVGGMVKDEVRAAARRFGLPTASRADSQDLCFLAGGDYRDFLRRRAPQMLTPGPILTVEGKQVGEHSGLAGYTIGQRKGLGVASPEPLYVLERRAADNALVIGPLSAMGRSELITSPLNTAGPLPPEPFQAQVKIRYTAAEAPATVSLRPDGGAHIRFDAPQRDITPGQAAVLYTGERCLGGGLILSTPDPQG